jgi:hypothetical protein
MNNKDDVRLAHEAMVNYHNALVQMRFSVASLFVAAAAFLVGAIVVDTAGIGVKKLLPMLGLMVTITAWILEVRTGALLANLVEQGIAYEAHLEFNGLDGFFGLLSKPQKIGIRVPFIGIKLPNSSKFIRRVFSHTFGLELIYLSFLLFWGYVMFAAK